MAARPRPPSRAISTDARPRGEGALTRDELIVLLIAALLAGLPAALALRMRALAQHPLWTRGLVACGVAAFVAPMALVAALIIAFQIFGIDVFD